MAGEKGVVADVRSKAMIEAALRDGKPFVLHFWAPWCDASKQMDQVFAHLATDYPHASFLRVRDLLFDLWFGGSFVRFFFDFWLLVLIYGNRYLITMIRSYGSLLFDAWSCIVYFMAFENQFFFVYSRYFACQLLLVWLMFKFCACFCAKVDCFRIILCADPVFCLLHVSMWWEKVCVCTSGLSKIYHLTRKLGNACC